MRFGGELFPNWVNLSNDSLFSDFFSMTDTDDAKALSSLIRERCSDDHQ
jgi:hypothetical protein